MGTYYPLAMATEDGAGEDMWDTLDVDYKEAYPGNPLKITRVQKAAALRRLRSRALDVGYMQRFREPKRMNALSASSRAGKQGRARAKLHVRRLYKAVRHQYPPSHPPSRYP